MNHNQENPVTCSQTDSCRCSSCVRKKNREKVAKWRKENPSKDKAIARRHWKKVSGSPEFKRKRSEKQQKIIEAFRWKGYLKRRQRPWETLEQTKLRIRLLRSKSKLRLIAALGGITNYGSGKHN